ncbi:MULTISPECIES: DUF4429 domain-containing protein [unclassified Streptomyces]|uniref:DUF4429 domain-containing protein n=1 Tax=unclassified Streptomyces TaxID=2593676 RepID=UPI001660BA2A|nr:MULTISPECIES: DUF4429 domain-containing protein [unclassified Streptomyces]MBD0707994.1 hypothetical protein [Streptomyces sp. CBMA291]MBD0715912.1 hypothetical protein [Streptomyces sp. CBMA370]
MGDVLAGIHATWEFESDALVIRFERGIRTPKLFQALRERRVPHEALASVTLAPGKRGTVVLRAAPRPGADPLVEAAAGQLKEEYDPYRLVVPAEREALAVFHHAELLSRIEAAAPGADFSFGVEPGGVVPAERFLVEPPRGALSFKAYDGRATFDGTSEVAFRWSSTGASSEKWKAGDQFFSVRDLCGVEWRSPDVLGGHLRMVRRGGDPRSARPDRDPDAVVFGLGYGPVHESLPFAAAVLSAIRTTDRTPARVAAPGVVAERIRHLGELHQAGLVTDEEFSAKKAELLAEL